MYNENEFADAFLSLRPSVWDKLATSKKIDVAQRIVDFYLLRMGVGTSSKVVLSNFHDTDTIAQCDPRTNTIALRRDMVEDGTLSMPDGKKVVLAHPHNQIFFYLIHEVKHAEQCYFLNNPLLCEDKNWLRLIQCNQRCAGELNSYFTKKMRMEAPKA